MAPEGRYTLNRLKIKNNIPLNRGGNQKTLDGKDAVICEETVMEGVADYHDGKQTWCIP